MPCSTCERNDGYGEGSLIPVWQDPSDYDEGKPPDFVGCTECHTMEPYPTGSDTRDSSDTGDEP